MKAGKLLMTIGAVCALSSAGPAAEVGDEFDTLQGWVVKGKGTAAVTEGRLVAQGVSLSKTFTLDPDQYPFFELKIDAAPSDYVVKASLPNQPERDLVRSNRAGVFKDSLPLKTAGPTTVQIHFYLGGGPYSIDYFRFLPPPMREPAVVPPEAAALAPPAQAAPEHKAHAWYLVNPQLALAVWKTNGCVAAGWATGNAERGMRSAESGAATGAVKCLAYCSDLYRIETRTNEVAAFEQADEVHEAKVAADGTRLDLVCRNAALPGIEIRKSYWLRPEPNIVAKRVEFRTDRDWQGVIHWVHSVALDPAFREGGFYNNRDYHPPRDAFVYAKDIRVPVRQPEGQQVYFVSPRTGLTAASYRLRANDRIVGPWCYFTAKGAGGAEGETDQFFTARGWQFKAHLDRLWPQARPSAEVHYTVLRGDFSHFHRQFMALPEFAEANDMVAPPWVREVKGQGPPSVPLRTSPQAANGVDALLDEGWSLYMQALGRKEGATCGWQAAPVSAEDEQTLSGLVRHVRANSSRMKLGIYAWLHSVSPQNPAVTAHPDWFIRDRDGQPIRDNMGMYSRLLVPEHVDYVRAMIRQVQTRHNMDYFYVDGGGFGRTDVDWPTLRVVQPYDYMRMYEGTRVDGRPSFFNAIDGLRGFYNAMGFFEGFIDVEDWRALAIKLYEVKLYQQPGTWSMPLYLRQDNRQPYLNYCVLLGLRPEADISRANLPLINMAYELGEMIVRDAGVTPCWWLEQTELEAYALGWPSSDAFLLTFLSHAKAAKEYEVGFNPAMAGLAPDRPVYVYHLRPPPASDLWANKLSEPEDRAAYAQQGWCSVMLPRIEAFEEYASPAAAARRTRTVRADVVELLGVTQTPALIWSVNGHRKYFPMSRTRWGAVTGTRDTASVRLMVDCTQACEVATLVPAAWSAVQATVDGQPAAHRRILPDLAVAPVPAGRHELVVRPVGPAQRPTPRVASVEMPERVERGQTLAIRVALDAPLTNAVVGVASLALGANPVYASTGLTFAAGAKLLAFDVTPPVSLVPGDYTARVAFEGLALADGPNAAELARPVAVAIDPIRVPEGWDAHSNAVEKVRDINHLFEYGADHVGYRVLRAFEQVSGKSPSNLAAVDTGSYWNDAMWATVAAGMGEERVAGYAHAGVEMDNLRVFSANIAFSRPPAVNGREVFAVDPRAQVSLSVDFHTPTGYVKRVYFYASGMNETFGARSKPWWGTATEPESVAVSVQQVPFTAALRDPRGHWDLADYAPAGWDGRVILGSNVSRAEPGTRLFLRILPEAKFREEAAAFTPDTVGDERQRENYKYRQMRPIAKGEGAQAGLDETNMVFTATAGGAGAYALAGIYEWNFLIPRLTVEAAGTAFLAVDYLTNTGIAKRVFAVLSGEGPDTAGPRLRGLSGLGACQGPVEVIDLRADVAAAAGGYDFGLGRYGYQDWAGKSKRALFHAGALGPGGRVKVRIVANDDFWRF